MKQSIMYLFYLLINCLDFIFALIFVTSFVGTLFVSVQCIFFPEVFNSYKLNNLIFIGLFVSSIVSFLLAAFITTPILKMFVKKSFKLTNYKFKTRNFKQ